jgi:Phage integrase family
LGRSQETEDHGDSPPGGVESRRRSGVPLGSRQQRLEARATTLPDDQQPLDIDRRLVRFRLERSATEVRLLASATRGMGRERFRSELGTVGRLRIPTILADLPMSVQDQERAGERDVGHPILAEPTVVSRVARSSLRDATSTSYDGGNLGVSAGRPPPSDGPRIPYSNRLAFVRHRLRSKGFPRPVTDLITDATRRSTQSAYQSAWKNWHSWCLRRHIDPLSNDLVSIACFLSDLFEEGLSFSTINICRSMFSATLDPIDGWSIGGHPLIKNLLKGIYNRNPPRPRYTHTWDVRIVVDYLKILGPPEDLDLMTLSCKTAMLLALSTFFRVSELASITAASLRFSSLAVNFSLSRPRKTQHTGALHSFELRRHPDNCLCPVHCLNIYRLATRDLRESTETGNLFVRCNRPHSPVSKATLAGWIKRVLREAGIENHFSAHSTRGAATSNAAREGVSIDTILKQADWTNESTFIRFYRRDL